jgi:hypothetical protein
MQNMCKLSIDLDLQYLFGEAHRQRISSPALGSVTGMLITVVVLTRTYWGEVTCGTGGLLIKSSGRFRRSIKDAIDHPVLPVAAFCKVLQAEPVKAIQKYVLVFNETLTDR